MATPALALRKAIELVEKNGWIQGAMHTPGGFCALGAIRQGAVLALGGDQEYDCWMDDEFRATLAELREVTDAHVREVIRERYDYASIVFWNDAAKRTREEVLGVFHEALRRAES